MEKISVDSLKQTAFVIRELSKKENKRANSETKLGAFWNIVDPLLYMIVLSTYYSMVMSSDIQNRPLFVLSGIMIFRFYQNGTTGAMHALVRNKNFLIRTKVSKNTFILERVYSAFKQLCYTSVALLVIMYIYKVHIHLRVFQAIPILFLTSVIITGIGRMLAILYMDFADIDYLYSLFMTIMMFASGVFIPLERMPGFLQRILSYNPIFLSIYLFRNSVIYNLPSHYTAWVKLGVWAVGIYVVSRCRGNVIGDVKE